MNAFQLRDVTGVRLVGRQGSEGRGSGGGGMDGEGGGSQVACTERVFEGDTASWTDWTVRNNEN